MTLWRALALAFATAILFAQTPQPQLVSFDLLALNAGKHPVADLRQDEIRITDDGKPQTILYFRAATPEDTFPHTTVLIIDQLNAEYNLSSGDWDRIGRALRAYPRPGQLYCYLLTIRGTLFPIRPLPDSWLAAELPDVSWARELSMPFSSLTELNGELPKELQGARNRQNITFTAYEELAARLAHVPGTRSVVWVGSRGVGKVGLRDPSSPRSTDGEYIDGVRQYFTGDHLGSVAATLSEAFANAQQRYRISYLPPPANWNGEVHAVRASTTRSGVRIVTRPSYIADKGGDLAFNQQSRLPDLLQLAPFDSTVLRLRADTNGVLIDAPDVLFLPEGERYTIRLAVQAIRFSDAPPAAIGEPRVFTRTFTAAERTAALHGGIRIPAELPAPSPNTSIRIVAADLYTAPSEPLR